MVRRMNDLPAITAERIRQCFQPPFTSAILKVFVFPGKGPSADRRRVLIDRMQANSELSPAPVRLPGNISLSRATYPYTSIADLRVSPPAQSTWVMPHQFAIAAIAHGSAPAMAPLEQQPEHAHNPGRIERREYSRTAACIRPNLTRSPAGVMLGLERTCA